MSNYRTKAKRPNSDEWESVTMLDDFYGRHRYGVEFPDDMVYPAEVCEIENN